ncbi:MAG: FAD-binding oxidoreductase [Terriglobia bacterium]
MKRLIPLLVIFLIVPGLAELKAATYIEGNVASMHSVPCGRQAKSHKRVERMLCEQYVIRTDTMAYRIRQEMPKKVNILPVGQEVYFRVKKNRMVIRGYTVNGKKIKNQEYVVVSERQRVPGTVPGSP